MAQWCRILAWHLTLKLLYKQYRTGKWKLFGYHLSYLVMSWRWRRGTWKGPARVPRQRKQNPTSCPAGRSGWPHCAGSAGPPRAGSGCSSCRSSRRSAPSPRRTWQHSGKTWLRNTQRSSRRIPLGPESNSLRKKRKREREGNALPRLFT